MDSKNTGKMRKIATFKRPDIVTTKRKITKKLLLATGKWPSCLLNGEEGRSFSKYILFKIFWERITDELFASNLYIMSLFVAFPNRRVGHDVQIEK